MSALIRSGVPQVPVYANWGRWVVDCPVCPSAEKSTPGDAAVECGYCGAFIELLWPAETMRTGVERLLMMRPDPSKRNWVPGESLHDLLAENVEHGIGPREEGQSLTIVGDSIIRDTLPASVQRRKIGA